MADLLAKEKEDDIYQPSVKIFPLLILEVGSAFLMSFYFRQLITGPNLAIGQLIWFLAGLCLFIIFSFFAALFVKGFLWSSLAAGISVAAVLAVFFDYFSAIFISFGILIFFIFIWGIHGLREEMENNLKINLFRLLKIFLSKTVLGTAILLTLFSYFLSSNSGAFPISFNNFQSFVLKPNEGLVRIFIPGFSFQKPLQTVLTQVLEKQLAASLPNFENLPASAKQTILNSAVKQDVLGGLEKFLGSKINSKDSVDKVIYDSLIIKFSQLNKTARNWLIIGMFASLFFVIRFLFIPFNWLLSIIMFLIYLSLLGMNFASVRMESRSKEVLVI